MAVEAPYFVQPLNAETELILGIVTTSGFNSVLVLEKVDHILKMLPAYLTGAELKGTKRRIYETEVLGPLCNVVAENRHWFDQIDDTGSTVLGKFGLAYGRLLRNYQQSGDQDQIESLLPTIRQMSQVLEGRPLNHSLLLNLINIDYYAFIHLSNNDGVVNDPSPQLATMRQRYLSLNDPGLLDRRFPISERQNAEVALILNNAAVMSLRSIDFHQGGMALTQLESIRDELIAAYSTLNPSQASLFPKIIGNHQLMIGSNLFATYTAIIDWSLRYGTRLSVEAADPLLKTDQVITNVLVSFNGLMQALDYSKAGEHLSPESKDNYEAELRIRILKLLALGSQASAFFDEHDMRFLVAEDHLSARLRPLEDPVITAILDTPDEVRFGAIRKQLTEMELTEPEEVYELRAAISSLSYYK